MRIVRLKRGYRINLSDSEYDALSVLATFGAGDIEAMETYEYHELPSKVKRGLGRITGPGSWALAADRR